MPLVKVIRIGSKRSEMALERIATALEDIRLILMPEDAEKTFKPELKVTEVSEVLQPEDRDESEGIEE